MAEQNRTHTPTDRPRMKDEAIGEDTPETAFAIPSAMGGATQAHAGDTRVSGRSPLDRGGDTR